MICSISLLTTSKMYIWRLLVLSCYWWTWTFFVLLCWFSCIVIIVQPTVILTIESSLVTAILGLAHLISEYLSVVSIQKGAGDFIGEMKFCPRDSSKVFVASGDGTVSVQSFEGIQSQILSRTPDCGHDHHDLWWGCCLCEYVVTISAVWHLWWCLCISCGCSGE